MADAEVLVMFKMFVAVVVKIPSVKLRMPPILAAPLNDAPPALLRVRLLNVAAGIVCAVDASKITVPPHVLPPEIGVPDVFCVLMIPALFTPDNAKVPVNIFKLALALIVKVSATVISLVAETAALVFDIVNLLKEMEEPFMLCAEAPFITIVLPAAVKVPLFIEKLPPIESVKAPVVKEVPVAMEKFPSVFMAANAVAEADPDMEKLPPMFKAVPGIVLIPLPLRIRLE